MSDALNQRWDAFLNQLKERFEELMSEADQVCSALLLQTDFNTIALASAWNGIEMRCKELESKIADAWISAIQPQFEDSGASPTLIAAARARGQALQEWLELERERHMLAIYNDAARVIFEHALAQDGAWQCKQCGGHLDTPRVFRTVNIQCAHCRAVNAYEPGPLLRSAAALLVHPLCHSRAWNEWLAVRAAEKAWHAARPATLPLLKAWEQANVAYWRAYLQAEATWAPEHSENLDSAVRKKMRNFYFVIENERVWADAGRPRDS